VIGSGKHLTYYDTATITAVKSYITLASGVVSLDYCGLCGAVHIRQSSPSVALPRAFNLFADAGSSLYLDQLTRNSVSAHSARQITFLTTSLQHRVAVSTIFSLFVHIFKIVEYIG